MIFRKVLKLLMKKNKKDSDFIDLENLNYKKRISLKQEPESDSSALKRKFSNDVISIRKICHQTHLINLSIQLLKKSDMNVWEQKCKRL